MVTRLQRKFIPWIFHHGLEFKWYYLGAIGSLYILQVFQAQLPQRIRRLTELMSIGDLKEASVWVFFALAIGIFIFRTLSRLLFFYPARVQQKLLRMELLERMEKVPFVRFSHRSQGQIFQNLFDDVNQVRALIGFGFLQIGNLVIAGFVLIPRVNETDAYLWPAFSPLFVSILLFTLVSLVNKRIYKKMAEKKGEVQQFIIESYQAKQTIKNFHREESFIDGFIRLSRQELSLFFRASVGLAVVGPYVKLGLGISLLWAAALIRARGGSPSDLVFFSGFLYLFLEPVMFMSWVAVVLSDGFVAWRRLHQLSISVDTPSRDETVLNDSLLKVSEESIHVGSTLWDRDFSLDFKTRRWTVIAGETGSGKSFFLSKLATLMILRGEKVSMVQQEPYLFNDTVEQNIFLGRVPTPAERLEVNQLLQMFQLESVAGDLDELLSLEVGENGKRLSGGQMKRVALIRSLVSGAAVLIWDDPFSSVDIIAERKIITALKASPVFGKKTFIISSHRLTTVRLSDDLIFLERGEGIKLRGPVTQVLKDDHALRFFNEQMVDLPLA